MTYQIKKGTGDREKVEIMNKDNVYEVEYMLGNEEKSGYVIADNESMASDVAYFLFGEGEDEPYKEIGIYDNSMYDFFVLERENDGSYENEIFETKEEAFSKIGVDGWTMDDLKVYSEGESYDFKKWNFEEMKNKILKKFNGLTFPIRTVVCDGKKYVGRLASDDECWEMLSNCNYLYGFMINEENSQITKMFFNIPEGMELDDDDNYKEAVSCEEIEEL